MTTKEQLVSIEEARELVSLLESGNVEAANVLVHDFKTRRVVFGSGETHENASQFTC